MLLGGSRRNDTRILVGFGAKGHKFKGLPPFEVARLSGQAALIETRSAIGLSTQVTLVLLQVTGLTLVCTCVCGPPSVGGSCHRELVADLNRS